MTNYLNSICDSWLSSVSFSIVWDFLLSFHLGLVSLSPIVCETLPVSLCFLRCSAHFPSVMVLTSVVEYLWDSVVQSPWSSNLTEFGLWFMLALCMSLVFLCCWVFLWWVFPTSCLSEGQSVHHLLFSVVQVWAGCVGAVSSLFTRFWGFSLALVQLFVLTI